MILPNCNDLLGILVASKKLAHGARAHEGECCFRRTKSGTFVLGLTAHDVRRMTHGGECWFQHTKSETFFVYARLKQPENQSKLTKYHFC